MSEEIKGDPEKGKKIFIQKCQQCHNVAPLKNGVGPSLHQMYGRKTGQAPNYSYSAANKDRGNVAFQSKKEFFLLSFVNTWHRLIRQL